MIEHIRKLSPKKLTAILDRSTLFRKWIDAIEAHAIDRLERGKPVEGYTLVKRYGRRRWTESLVEVNKALIAAGADPAELGESVLSPAQAEKLVDPAVVAAMCERPELGVKLSRIEPSTASFTDLFGD